MEEEKGEGMTIKYQEHEADSIMQYFVDGFVLKPGTSISRHEWFYDASMRRVVFKLYVDEGDYAS